MYKPKLSPSSQYNSPSAVFLSFNAINKPKLFFRLAVVVREGFWIGKIKPPLINKGIVSNGASRVKFSPLETNCLNV